MNMKIFLHKSLVQNEYDFSDFDFLVYTGLKLIMGTNDKTIYYVSLNQIVVELFGSLSISRRLRVGIKNSLMNLTGYDDNSLVKITGKLDDINNEFILDLSKLYVDTKKTTFITVSDEDIRKVLKINFNGFKETVFRYYCVILSTINNTDNICVGNMTLKYIRGLIDNVSTEATQLKYNKLLENAKVLYIHHNEYLVHDGNGVKALPNFYGKYEDKDKVDEIARKKLNSIKNPIEFSPLGSNEIRSLKQKINALGKGTKYSDQEMNAMKSLAEQENKRLLDMMISTDDEMLKYSLSKRLINMSIFDDNNTINITD